MQPPSPTTPQSTRSRTSSARSARGAVQWLSVCFFLLFSGFQAAQGLQSSLNKVFGLLNLAVLYSTFAFCLFQAPALVTFLERKTGGLPWVMLIGGSCYALSIFLTAIPSTETGVEWVVLGSFAALGIGAALLWTAEAEYLGRCAIQAARRTGGSEAVGEATADLNGIFFGNFQFAGLAGTGLSAFLLGTEGRGVLFIILGFLAILGVLGFLGLPNIAGGRDLSVAPSYRATLSVSITGNFLPLLPLIFSNGLMLGFFVGPFLEEIGAPILGPSWVPVLLCVFFLVNSISTKFWGIMMAGKRTNEAMQLLYESENDISKSLRFYSVICGSLICFFGVLFLMLPIPAAYKESKSGWEPTGLNRSESMEIGLRILLISLVGIFAFADSFFESQLPAAVQASFQNGGQGLAANAAYKLWQTLGTATQLSIALVIGWRQQIVVLFSFTFLGVWALFYGARSVQERSTETVDELGVRI